MAAFAKHIAAIHSTSPKVYKRSGQLPITDKHNIPVFSESTSLGHHENYSGAAITNAVFDTANPERGARVRSALLSLLTTRRAWTGTSTVT